MGARTSLSAETSGSCEGRGKVAGQPVIERCCGQECPRAGVRSSHSARIGGSYLAQGNSRHQPVVGRCCGQECPRAGVRSSYSARIGGPRETPGISRSSDVAAGRNARAPECGVPCLAADWAPHLASGKYFMTTKLLFLSVSLAFTCLQGRAAIYIVDQNAPGAADTNPGTEAKPFKTIQHAADLSQPGDAIFVMTGHYPERVRVKNS